MKPKRWLAYTVELNDLLPSYDRILQAFELSEVPLDATFGSNSEPGQDMPGVLIAIGPAVEPARLGEILDLLEGIGQVFLAVHEDGAHKKVIYVGALNLNDDLVVPLTPDVLAITRRAGATAGELMQAIKAAPKLRTFPGKGRRV